MLGEISVLFAVLVAAVLVFGAAAGGALEENVRIQARIGSRGVDDCRREHGHGSGEIAFPIVPLVAIPRTVGERIRLPLSMVLNDRT